MQQENRVETALKVWQKYEDRYETIIPGFKGKNIPILKMKLGFFENLSYKYSNSKSFEEQLLINSLNVEKSNLKKVLYPNPIVRLLRDLFKTFKAEKNIRHHQNQTSKNITELSGILIKSGFAEGINQLAHNVHLGKDSFSISTQHYQNLNERIDFNLNFRKIDSGEYELVNYKASLYSDSKEVRSLLFSLDKDFGLSRNETFNLLSGWPLLKQVDVPWSELRWLQLDVTDKDVDGNCKLKNMKAEQDVDLVGIIKKAGITDYTSLDINKLVENLSNGNEVELKINNNEQNKICFIRIKPFSEELDFFDGNKNRVSRETMFSDHNSNKVIELNPAQNEENVGRVKQKQIKL